MGEVKQSQADTANAPDERRKGVERRTEEVERAERSRQEFLSVLSHELRNPIQAIHTNAVLIKARAKDVDLCRPAEAIERQVARLSRILDDLLDVVRLAQGEELAFSTATVQEVVNQALEAARRSMDTHRRELSVHMPETPLYIRADSRRLAQALGNVIANAVKYSPQQGEIVVRAFAQDDEALITVRDFGVGIAAEDLPRIFRRYTDASIPRDRSGGLGIGLHVACQLVELHQGRIEARSEGVGKGAEFLIHLPLTAERPERERPARPYVEAPAMRILVVDDNRDSADSLAMLLETHGHTGLVAYDGSSAIEKAEKLRPQVALVDIGMPTMDGFEVARRITSAEWGKETVVVAVSGWGAKSDRAKAKESGFAYHLTKPVDYDTLASLLSAIVRKPRAGR